MDNTETKEEEDLRSERAGQDSLREYDQPLTPEEEEILSTIPDDHKEIVKTILKRKGGAGVLYSPPPPPGKRCPTYRFHQDDDEEGVSKTICIAKCTNEERKKYCDPSKITKKGELIPPEITVDQIKAKMKEREEAPAKVVEQQKTIATLQNTINSLVERDKETAFNEYKELTETRLNKMASLIQQLIGGLTERQE